MNKQQFDTAKKQLTKLIPAFAARIAPVYVVLNWHWGAVYGHRYIPTTDHIEDTLSNLIQDIEPRHKSTSTGGLSVEVDEDGISMGFYVGVDSGETDPLG